MTTTNNAMVKTRNTGRKSRKLTQSELKLKATMERIMASDVETKYILTQVYGLGINYNGNSSLTIPVPQGTGDSQRTGDGITVSRLRMKGMITGMTTSAVRVIIFTYRALTTQLLISQLFPSNALGMMIAPYAPYTHDFKELFHVWADEFMSVDSAHPQRIFDMELKLKGKDAAVSYIAGSQTQCLNGLFVVFLSDQNNATTTAVNYVIEVEYYDA